MYSWNFGGNGLGNSTTSNGYWIYDTCNIYDNIYLTAIDTNGCKDTSNLVSTEVLCNTEASFTIDNATFCGPDTVNATTSSYILHTIGMYSQHL